jgi:hypothetical protein
MLVSQLIEKLQRADPNATVLVDQNAPLNTVPDLYPRSLGEATMAATGLAYKVWCENAGGYWVDSEPWRYRQPPNSLDPQSCVYIGSGQSIIEVKWTKL